MAVARFVRLVDDITGPGDLPAIWCAIQFDLYSFNPLNYELPDNLGVARFLQKLGDEVRLLIAAQNYSIKTFYDSFDWRLYNAGQTLELDQSRDLCESRLCDRSSADCIERVELERMPVFARDFPHGRMKTRLQPVLEMRALLSLGTLPYQAYRVNIMNKDQKTTVRLMIEEHDLISSRVVLLPMRGYRKQALRLGEILETVLGLAPPQSTQFESMLGLQGRQPNDTGAKVRMDLAAEMDARSACVHIYQRLLYQIRTNEAGAIADTDSEFLHDFRVGIRKTRSALSQLKQVFSVEETAQFAEFFGWLGRLTGNTRDLDVYLLNFQTYRDSLPPGLREDLDPLYDFIQTRQRAEQRYLAEHLKSSRYRTGLTQWEDFLSAAAKPGASATEYQPVRWLADHRIWRTYKRVIREGDAITDESPATALHDLRKSCKKLRYLMEFFQGLYPGKEVALLIRALKGFQEVLGDFQDYEVQENALKAFSEEMLNAGVPARTFLAMGVLVQDLGGRRQAARGDFEKRYEEFTREKNKSLFRRVFANQAEK